LIYSDIDKNIGDINGTGSCGFMVRMIQANFLQGVGSV